jgi:PhnB protein
MPQSWKPPHYPSLAPYLAVDGAQRVIDFLRAAFDAVELRRHDAPNGKVMHAELRIDDTVVMLMDGAGDWPAFPVWLHLYVPDVDAAYQRALAAGGTSVQAPVQKGDPDKRCGVKDPAGNTWWIATQVGGA